MEVPWDLDTTILHGIISLVGWDTKGANVGLAVLALVFGIVSFFAMNPKGTEGILWTIEDSITASELLKKIENSSCEHDSYENPRSETDEIFLDLKSINSSIKFKKSKEFQLEAKFKFYMANSGKLFVYQYDRKGTLSPKPKEYILSELNAAKDGLSTCLKIELGTPRMVNLE